MAEKSVFEVLNSINVNEHTEKKNGLTYLSWAWGWAEVKKRFPDAVYTIYENENGWPYFTDGHTAWVKTGVTINGLEHIEYLPIMDFKNKSIPVDQITSMDMNKSIQRSLTKAIARHGLGLYIYAGEDLPEDATKDEKPIVSEQEMAKPIDAAAWKGLQRELKDAGLNAAKVVGYYGLEKPSQITWDLLGQIRSEIKYLKKIEELKAEVA